MAKNLPSCNGDGSKAQNQIYILVLGAIGSGKSTLVNSLSVGKRMRVGPRGTQDPCTVDIDTVNVNSSKYVIPEVLQHRQIVLVDTPGFDHPEYNDYQISEKISAWLANLRRDGKALGGVLYLYDLSHERITGTAKDRLNLLRTACGKESMRGTILVTTKSSQIHDKDKAKVAAEREDSLKKRHWAELLKDGARVIRFDDDFASGSKILNNVFNNFINGPGALNLDVQKDLVDNGLTFDKTGAGKYSAQAEREKSQGFLKRLGRFLRIVR